ncbi:uncharacterized protein LOC110612714 [Manihot esculenta]|uniref:uncharacterized protein LOC110612714 n=1 Tax=Manihot esculenta TaxID=3983 RepID=UPI001CC59015|nr:uncharacterized protein LOC110612714 [Manihot esculenta]
MSIRNLETQISQLVVSVNKLENQGKLPSQTTVNPKQNVCAVTLRSEKELQDDPHQASRSHDNPHQVSRGHNRSTNLETKMIVPEQDKSASAPEQSEPLIIKPPFPQRLARSKQEKEEKEVLETFRKVEVNIPLLDAIKQVPRYAKFLKELCTNKKKLVGYQKVCMGENVSAVFQNKMPTKCKDQCMFAIPVKIGNIGVKKAMCDLGASINIMPLSVFQSLNAGPLKETGVVIQLADHSIVYPDGVLENVLVQVDNLIFPADFYVISMEDNKSSNSFDILLGRPFLSTARTKINVYDDILTMEFDGEIIEFNVYDDVKHPNNVYSVCRVDASKPLVQQVLKLEYGDELNTKLCENFGKSNSMNMKENFDYLKEVVYELKANKSLHHIASIEEPPNIHTKFSASIVQGIKVEHKSLPGQPPPFINENRTSHSLKLPFEQVFLKSFYKGFKVEPAKEITFSYPTPIV